MSMSIIYLKYKFWRITYSDETQKLSIFHSRLKRPYFILPYRYYCLESMVWTYSIDKIFFEVLKMFKNDIRPTDRPSDKERGRKSVSGSQKK